jgi:pimeloyl-ACP methyl ester carboxylesterase
VTTDKDQQKGYASVNGLDLYYEIRGSGKPLVLLPGGFMTVEAMGEIVPQLAATRRVIGIELQGHGHTADTQRPLRFELMAEDIAALIRHLGFEQADMFGFSLGGGVALRTAIQHPEVVRKLALASTAFKRDGWYPEVLAGMASISVETFAGTPIHEAYLKTSPRPEVWPTFVAKMRQLLSEDYDWAARGAPGHHACWLGSPVSWDYDSHPTAPADPHRIPRFTHARGQVSRRPRKSRTPG